MTQAPSTQQQVAQEAAGPSPSPTRSISLYTGDSQHNVTEAQLYEVYMRVPITAVVLIGFYRDSMTKLSLGFVYLTYNTVEEAARALPFSEFTEFTELTEVNTKFIFSYRDPKDSKRQKGKIFIKNLKLPMDREPLFKTFLELTFGSTVSYKIKAYPSSGLLKGCSIVQIEFEESATSAIENMNGTWVSAAPFDPPRLLSSEFWRTVCVRNISTDMTEEDLASRFRAFGEVRGALVRRKANGTSEGCGFVDFKESCEATRAVEAFKNETKVDSEKNWYVEKAHHQSKKRANDSAELESDEPEETTEAYPFSVFLENLDETIDEDKLSEFSAEFGTVTCCEIWEDSSVPRRTLGFVAFSTAEARNRALSEMSGRILGRRRLYTVGAQNEEGYGHLGTREAQSTETRPTFGINPEFVPMYQTGIPEITEKILYVGKQPRPALTSQLDSYILE